MNEWIRKYGLKAVMGAGLLLLAGCQSNYSLVRVEGGRVPITAVYDEYPDKEAEKLVEHYKEKVDSIMSPVIGCNFNSVSSRITFVQFDCRCAS